MSDKTREEAAAIGFHAAMDTPFSEAVDWLEEVTAGIAAADAHDTANGIHRVSLDEATVERAAQALLDAFYDDKTLKVDDENRDIVRAVLAAAVKEER